MEKLRIEIGDKPMVVEPEMTVEVNEEFPKEIRSGYFEVMADLPKPEIVTGGLRD